MSSLLLFLQTTHWLGWNMERRQPYCTLPSNKNRHDEVRWASSLVPASPIAPDWGPGLCKSGLPDTSWIRRVLSLSSLSLHGGTGPALHQWGLSAKLGGQLSVIAKATGPRVARLSAPRYRITKKCKQPWICNLHWQVQAAAPSLASSGPDKLFSPRSLI